ncbi:DUF3055 domain-containing protein [Desertibacillus haloalkaliphilus]|uniref:DUF3055 domain-containing protein n=1 Tax=Desertibacillus haloalkaliphilus TaxID=1328930 RepID=UPI001C26DB13|nr:DUF3055 domain-containing protein [Desertibacillus haloalkaliphilus]MBU8906744.1 DUF3055 domain-containing protein [Desertibacillus haloalkaliphilus]
MNLFERLYDEQENVKVQFIGFTTDEVRYDFGIVYTNMFFGKPLVICMQTGRSTLLSAEDVKDVKHLQNVFHIKTKQEAEDLASFFDETLPNLPLEPQY